MNDQLTQLGGRVAVVAKMQTRGLIAVVRARHRDPLVQVCQALADGGVELVEITMTSPGALEVIEQASRRLSAHCTIGAGSVLDAETARAAILAGARFIVAPVLDRRVIEMAHRYDLPVIPGALTPTEIMTAWQAGADMVKVFPANHFGPRYFKDLLAPMPQLQLTPTGGVDLTTAAQWLAAGAACLGVGSALVRQELIDKGNWAQLTSLARQFVQVVHKTRSELARQA